MKTIYKYQLGITDNQQIETFKYCQVLSVQMQGVVPCLWILVDTNEPKQTINVSIFGTGHSIPKHFRVNSENNLYVGTFQPEPLVFHVFVSGIFTSF